MRRVIIFALLLSLQAVAWAKIEEPVSNIGEEELFKPSTKRVSILNITDILNLAKQGDVDAQLSASFCYSSKSTVEQA